MVKDQASGARRSKSPSSIGPTKHAGRAERVEIAFFSDLDPTRTIIYGIGEPWRGDDAVGLWLATLLGQRGFPARAIGRDGFALMEAWAGWAAVIVVDAVMSASGAKPGQVFAIDGLAETLLPEPMVSTHHFGLVDAVKMGRILGKLPSRLLIYGIEADRFDLGNGVQPVVKRGAAVVARRIAAGLNPNACNAVFQNI